MLILAFFYSVIRNRVFRIGIVLLAIVLIAYGIVYGIFLINFVAKGNNHHVHTRHNRTRVDPGTGAAH